MKPSERASQAISLTQLRKYFYHIFLLMTDTHISFRVSHRNKIYIMTIEPTGELIKRRYRRSKLNPRNRVDPGLIEASLCPNCGELMLAGVCMNKDCDKKSRAHLPDL